MKSRAIVTSLALGLALAGAPVQAADADFASRAASSVGRYIAAQGNAALVQIQDEMKQRLPKSLKPLLPEPPRAASTRQQATNTQ